MTAVEQPIEGSNIENDFGWIEIVELGVSRFPRGAFCSSARSLLSLVLLGSKVVLIAGDLLDGTHERYGRDDAGCKLRWCRLSYLTV